MSVHAIGRHSVERVGDRDDAAGQGNLVAGELARVAAPVPALVVAGDRVEGRGKERDALEHALADLGVAPHDPPLGVVERSWLA